MCAEVKYPKDAGAMKKLEQKLLGGAGPKTVNPVVRSRYYVVEFVILIELCGYLMQLLQLLMVQERCRINMYLDSH